MKNPGYGWKTVQQIREAHDNAGERMESRSVRFRQFLTTYQKVYAQKGLGAGK
jgi:hypothetical protein